MIEESARVKKLEGEYAWVEAQRQTTCGQCAANKGCGTALLGKVLGRRRTMLRARSLQGVSVGDDVVVGIREGALVRGSLAIYAVPMAGLLAGAGFGRYLGERMLSGNAELVSIAGGLTGLIAGLMWVRYFTRRIAGDADYQPVILRRISSALPFEAGSGLK